MKKFHGVYYGWGCHAKGTYEKMTMYKDVKNLVEGYKKYTGNEVKLQKNRVAPVANISKSNLY